MTGEDVRYLESHRRRWLDVAVVLFALAVLAGAVLVRSGSGTLDITPERPVDWIVSLLALAAVPAWFLLGDGVDGGWLGGRGLAVAADRRLVDEVTFDFDELHAEVAALGRSTVAAGGRLDVPLADGGSVTVRPRDPAHFTAALEDACQRWTAGQAAPPGR